MLNQPDLDPPHFWWEAGEIMVIYLVEWRCQHDHVKYTQNNVITCIIILFIPSFSQDEQKHISKEHAKA